MNYSVLFHPEAEEEFSEATIWYKNQQRGLDLEFIRCVDESIQRIKRNPKLYPITHKNFRKVVVRRFPFIILYEENKKSIFILGVFHSRRNPKYLLDRTIKKI